MIVAQNVVIACLVLRFQRRRAGVGAFLAGLGALAWALLAPAKDGREELVSLEKLRLLQMAAAALSIFSKVPQIWTVWNQGGTGQLSAFTVGSFRGRVGKRGGGLVLWENKKGNIRVLG